MDLSRLPKGGWEWRRKSAPPRQPGAHHAGSNHQDSPHTEHKSDIGNISHQQVFRKFQTSRSRGRSSHRATRRRRHSKENQQSQSGIHPGISKDHPESINIILVENIPKQAQWKWIESVFRQFGKINRIFTPIKRSKKGVRYAFVSFNSQSVAISAIRGSNKMRFAGHLFTVELAKKARPSNQRIGSFDNSQGARLRAKITDSQNLGNQTVVHSCAVESNPRIKAWLQDSVIGISESLMDQESVARNLENIGLKDFSVIRIGPVEFIIHFNQEDVKKSLEFENWATLKSCSFRIIPWSDSFLVHTRVAWIQITNLPWLYWNQNNISKTVEPWGKVLATYVLHKLSYVHPCNNVSSVCH